MLRISSRNGAGQTTLIVEGKLAGPCVVELEKCWRAATDRGLPGLIVVDLTNVGFVDTTGKQLLTQMYADGIKLCATGLMSKLIIEEIENAQRSHKS